MLPMERVETNHNHCDEHAYNERNRPRGLCANFLNKLLGRVAYHLQDPIKFFIGP